MPVPRVVVAVNARPSSAAALAWAADEALCRGMRLRIVTAFADPDSPQLTKTVEQALRCQHWLSEELGNRRPWLDQAESIVRRGSLRSLISEATTPGDLLVIGQGAQVSAIHASQRARCPVVIVPPVPATP
jgi:hypothetical protein